MQKHHIDIYRESVEPEMCCNGHECGCMGLPIEVPLTPYEITVRKEYHLSILDNDIERLGIKEKKYTEELDDYTKHTYSDSDKLAGRVQEIREQITYKKEQRELIANEK